MEYQIDKLIKEIPLPLTEIEKGKWVCARPMDWQGLIKWKYRVKEALKVLKGKADILTWYKQ